MLLERVRAGSEKAAAELCPFPRSPGEGWESKIPRLPAEAKEAALGAPAGAGRPAGAGPVVSQPGPVPRSPGHRRGRLQGRAGGPTAAGGGPSRCIPPAPRSLSFSPASSPTRETAPLPPGGPFGSRPVWTGTPRPLRGKMRRLPRGRRPPRPQPRRELCPAPRSGGSCPGVRPLPAQRGQGRNGEFLPCRFPPASDGGQPPRLRAGFSPFKNTPLISSPKCFLVLLFVWGFFPLRFNERSQLCRGGENRAALPWRVRGAGGLTGGGRAGSGAAGPVPVRDRPGSRQHRPRPTGA